MWKGYNLITIETNYPILNNTYNYVLHALFSEKNEKLAIDKILGEDTKVLVIGSSDYFDKLSLEDFNKDKINFLIYMVDPTIEEVRKKLKENFHIKAVVNFMSNDYRKTVNSINRKCIDIAINKPVFHQTDLYLTAHIRGYELDHYLLCSCRNDQLGRFRSTSYEIDGKKVIII